MALPYTNLLLSVHLSTVATTKHKKVICKQISWPGFFSHLDLEHRIGAGNLRFLAVQMLSACCCRDQVTKLFANCLITAC